MCDWNALVRERLQRCGIPAAHEEQVTAELAAHLEDLCEQIVALGLSQAEAVQLCLKEVDDWGELARNIQRAQRGEALMNTRIKNLWLPGCVSLATATGFLTLLQHIGWQPITVSIGGVALRLYWPWLLALPLFGAAGAYLSCLAGGPRSARMVAGLFPAAAILLLMVIVLTSSLLVEPDVYFLHHPDFLALGLFSWLVLPALALLVGTLPFLRAAKPREP